MPTHTRRRVITQTMLSLAAAAPARAQPVIAARAIHQEETFSAAPHRVYEALLDDKLFTAFSGGRVARIDRSLGGAFSLFGGHIIGRNLELVADRRIVQSWRVVDWPEGVHSIARFELTPQSAGTRVALDHTGFPSDKAEHLASGWQENYWTALRKYLG